MKALKKIFKNRRGIFRGIRNSIIKKRKIERMYKQRKEICKKCPYIDNIGNTCLVKGTQPCCALCGCSLKFKLRDPESECDAGKWSAEEE